MDVTQSIQVKGYHKVLVLKPVVLLETLFQNIACTIYLNYADTKSSKKN